MLRSLNRQWWLKRNGEMPQVLVFDENGVVRDNVQFEVAPREGELIQWGDPGLGNAAFRKVVHVSHQQQTGFQFGYVITLALPYPPSPAGASGS